MSAIERIRKAISAGMWDAQWHGDLTELLAERDALKADAERYRWLREQPNDTTAPRIDVVRWIPADESVNDGEGLRLDELDAAIDAQIEKEKANGSR